MGCDWSSHQLALSIAIIIIIMCSCVSQNCPLPNTGMPLLIISVAPETFSFESTRNNYDVEVCIKLFGTPNYREPLPSAVAPGR